MQCCTKRIVLFKNSKMVISPIFVLLLLCAWGATPSESNRECEEKEKSLALLELAKDSINKAKDLVPHCGDDILKNQTLHNKTVCGKREKLEVYINIALNLIDGAKENYPNCDFHKDRKPDDKKEEKPDEEKEPLPSDCLDLQQKGFNKSGVYTIQLQSVHARNKTLDVFCDMDTDGGGWTVIQRRGNFKPLEDFYRGWNSYKNGFGNISRDFWIGNENIFFLSSHTRTAIRFDMGDVNGVKAYAHYRDFRIENEEGYYRLHISGSSGNAGDSMSHSDRSSFSTKDKASHSVDNTCPEVRKSGWWFNQCSSCNPNGLYQPGEQSTKTMFWLSFKDVEGLAFTEIKLKRYL